MLAISWGLKWGMVRAAVWAHASMRVFPGWCRRVANAQVALLMSWGTQRGRSVSSCSAAAAKKGSHGTYASLAKALHHGATISETCMQGFPQINAHSIITYTESFRKCPALLIARHKWHAGAYLEKSHKALK